jgi:hypothetical protein
MLWIVQLSWNPNPFPGFSRSNTPKSLSPAQPKQDVDIKYEPPKISEPDFDNDIPISSAYLPIQAASPPDTSLFQSENSGKGRKNNSLLRFKPNSNGSSVPRKPNPDMNDELDFQKINV